MHRPRHAGRAGRSGPWSAIGPAGTSIVYSHLSTVNGISRARSFEGACVAGQDTIGKDRRGFLDGR